MGSIESRLRRLEQQVGTTEDREKRDAEIEKAIEANLRIGLARFGYEVTPELIEQCREQRRMRIAALRKGVPYGS